MKFTRLIPVSSSHERHPLMRAERHLKQREFQTRRTRVDCVEASLFNWKDFFRSKDADRLNWNTLRLEQKDSALHLHMGYNWALQALAHLTLSLFVLGFFLRLGNTTAAAPVLIALNGILILASLFFARLYAGKLAREIGIAVAEEATI